MKRFIVAMDGPAGSGKSSVAKRLASRLNLPYMDTGAMYRALTYLIQKNRIRWSNVRDMIRVAKNARIQLKPSHNGALHVFANQMNVTRLIRTPQLTQQVHHVASRPGIRREMVKIQRRMGRKRGGVLEGRDIGSVVFPNAKFKFYLDADFKIRVRRRYRELLSKGIRVTSAAVARDLKRRDTQDKTRHVAPLKLADDAVLIDTGPLTIQGVVDIIFKFISCRK